MGPFASSRLLHAVLATAVASLVAVAGVEATGFARDRTAAPRGVTTQRAAPAQQDVAPVTSAAAADCGKTIEVNLTTQQLVATACGTVVLSSPITSGRPGLRTPTGTYSILLKEQNVTFNSPWPVGDPNYYPPMPVAYAIEFLDGGYFLHTDPDEPSGAFGPGSEDGPYASHGCVHVPMQAMVSLYSWADGGTRVTIHY